VKNDQIVWEAGRTQSSNTGHEPTGREKGQMDGKKEYIKSSNGVFT
jgi:hypothetical protein